MNLNILASDDTATFEITHMDAPVVSTKKASSLAQLTALAGGLIAGLGVPFGGSWGHRSGTNNGKSHSSAAQRRSPYYQPTGDDRMKLEQAEAKRKRKQRAARPACQGLTMHDEINWDLPAADAELMDKVMDRVKRHGITESDRLLNVHMSLTACHLNGTPLDLQKLLDFDDFDFVHDVTGIDANISRVTGQLVGIFLPRCAR